MRETPRAQEIYRHFKGNVYQIVAVATHTETDEELVIYQAMYGDFKIYARPINMFLEKVDRVKYPEDTCTGCENGAGAGGRSLFRSPGCPIFGCYKA